MGKNNHQKEAGGKKEVFTLWRPMKKNVIALKQEVY